MNSLFYKKEDRNKTIFITIAACEELFLEQTIKSAIALSETPERLFFGVFNNILDYNNMFYKDEFGKLNRPKNNLSLLSNTFFTQNKNIMYAELVTSTPMGTGYGRLNASLLSTNNEHDYFFQIDAHTIFSKGWDRVLISNYNRITYENNDYEKIILTCIPNVSWSYDINNKNIIWANIKIEEKDKKIFLSFYEDNFPEELHNGKTEITFTGWQKDEFEPTSFGFPIVYGGQFYEQNHEKTNGVHASFMFGKYKTIREVMHDPQDSFHGDQTNYTLRLLARDYKIFAVKKPLIATLNKYDESGAKLTKNPLYEPEHNWRAFVVDSESSIDYQIAIHNGSKKRYEDIISGMYLGYWGAEDMESLNNAKKIMGFENQ